VQDDAGLGSQESQMEEQPASGYDREEPGAVNWIGLPLLEDSTEMGLELRFDNVCLRKPKSAEFILSSINGTVKASSLTGIMGQSGSGKSKCQNLQGSYVADETCSE
jgi:ABC-type bacteriocin/lantibiotic exporter with double-glycine peptidase domain